MKYGRHISHTARLNAIALAALLGLGALLVISVTPLSVIATPNQQDVCTAQVRAALNRVRDACSELGRNEACYGNDLIVAEPRANIPLDHLTFSSAGDIADLGVLRRISTFPYDQTNNEWGIALIRAQVNLPDALPGQNVTFLLYGDTTLNAESPSMNVVSVRIRVGAMLCEGVPESALIIQSPANSVIQLIINGAEVRLGSTARITAYEGGALTISLLEGSAVVTALNTTQELIPGTETDMALGGSDGLTVIAPPGEPQPFVLTETDLLPLEVLEQRNWVGINEVADQTSDCPTPSHYIYQYVVRHGDTLSRIAVQAGVSVEELAAANCILDARFISVGQVLAVPAEITAPPPSVPVQSPDGGGGSGGHSAVCGNGLCERDLGENPGQCRLDCPPSSDGGACGNDICEPQYGENPGQCRVDCPPGGGDDDDDDDDD